MVKKDIDKLSKEWYNEYMDNYEWSPDQGSPCMITFIEDKLLPYDIKNDDEYAEVFDQLYQAMDKKFNKDCGY